MSHGWSSTQMTGVLEPYLYGIGGALDMVRSLLVNVSDQECVRNAVSVLAFCKVKSLGPPKT